MKKSDIRFVGLGLLLIGFVVSMPVTAGAKGKPNQNPPVVKAVGNIAVVEASGRIRKGKNHINDREVLRTFYGANENGQVEDFRGDHYDIAAIYTNFPVDAAGAFAYSVSVRNDILNIGLWDGLNDASFYGSTSPQYDGEPGNLNSYLFMNDLADFPDDPIDPIVSRGYHYGHQVLIAHEVGHLMCCYLSSTEGTINDGAAHWSYLWDTDGSYMHGAEWLPDPLDPTVSYPGTFEAAKPFVQYSLYDRYVWGEFADLNNADLASTLTPRGLLNAAGVKNWTEAKEGDQVEATSVTEITLDSILDAMGDRRNDPEGKSDYRIAFVLVVPEGTADAMTADHPDIAKLNDFREDFDCVFNSQMETVSMSTSLEGVAVRPIQCHN